ncbi:MAG: prolipoprotein diacylglyceryl transferase, partial [Myxococcales bacterium]|nr:prolipoprotein diacylglyceryl transferase [Myxococcales bacterium]
MHPILVDLNGFAIHTYGAMGALGFLFTAFTALWRGRKLGIAAERMADLIFWSALIALVGSRIVFLVQNPVFSSPWDWVNLRTGGLVFYGAILFGVPAGSLLIRRYGMPFFATWDIFAAAFPIAHGFARLGCFAAGCCYGSPFDGPWAVTFTDPKSVAPHDVALHPTQLYEAGFLFALGAVLQVVYAKKPFHGSVMLVYLLGYAAGRAVVEMYRGDASRGYFLPEVLGSLLSYSQGISL